MTLSSTANRVQYDGDSSTTAFPVTFVFWDDTDVVAVHTDADGVETTWTKGTQYTLSGGDGSTGTLTVETSPTDYTPATGETLTIYSARANTQPLSLPAGGAFPSTSVEQALDQLTRLVQQALTTIGLKLGYPVTEPSSTSAQVPALADRASMLLGFDGNGEPEAVDPAAVGSLSTTVSAFMSSMLDDATAHAARSTLELNTSVITELTIASGAVTVTGPIHTIDTEGDAASDNLDTLVIAGERLSGDFMVLLAASALREVNVTTDGNFGAACTLSATVPTVFMLVSSTWYPIGALQKAENLIVNGDFRVADEATSMTGATTPANNDDTYFNHCLLLSDGNDIADLTQETSVVPTGAYAALKINVQTANKKLAIGFPIEARDFKALAGGKASVQFKLRSETANLIENVRAYFLSWSSTADSITSDVISAWPAEGADPTFAANWTAENTAANIAVPQGAYGTFKIQDIDVDTASAANGMLLIMIDDTDAASGDLLYIADVCVEAGSIAHVFPRPPLEHQRERCDRLLQVFNYGNSDAVTNGAWRSGTLMDAVFHLRKKMRIVPTITMPTASDIAGVDAGSAAAGSSVSASSPSQEAFLIELTVASGGTTGHAGYVRAGASATPQIKADARL